MTVNCQIGKGQTGCLVSANDIESASITFKTSPDLSSSGGTVTVQLNGVAIWTIQAAPAESASSTISIGVVDGGKWSQSWNVVADYVSKGGSYVDTSSGWNSKTTSLTTSSGDSIYGYAVWYSQANYADSYVVNGQGTYAEAMLTTTSIVLIG